MNNMAGPAGIWPEEHTQELIRLCEEKLSYRAIAREMNAKFGTAYTKNAVLGKALRIGINKEAASSAPGVPRAPRAPRRPSQPRTPRKQISTVRIVSANGNSNAMRAFRSVSFELAKLRCVEIVPRNISLLDLGPEDCRYPYGDKDILFCGHPKAPGSPYCMPHHALCNEPPRIPIQKFAGVAA